jgi:hypothetical protein
MSAARSAQRARWAHNQNQNLDLEHNELLLEFWPQNASQWPQTS